MSSTRVKNLSPKFLDDKLKPEKDYWLAKLSGDLILTGIPLDCARPAEYSVQKKNVDIIIAPETERSLFKLCNNNESLVLTLLTTALKICLYKYTNIENVIVGTTIHNRYSEVASLNKVLALRDEVTATMTVKELLLQVKDTLSGAYANEKYPFERILDLLNIESPGNREALFNIAIILDNIGSVESLTGLKTDAALIFSSAAQRLTGHIQYNPALFKEATIQVFERHYAEILKRVLAQPEMQISSVELLSEEERSERLFVFNDTQTDYPRQETIHRLLEAQVRRTPDRIALVCRGHSITYRELNTKA